MRCPCGTGLTLDECCAPVLAGERQAPTAEALMRSRFTAFARGDAGYLLGSWHASTRPEALELDERMRWQWLEIVSRSGGGPFDREGTVAFVAHWRADAERGALRETSRFVREGGAWRYLDGDVA